MVKSEGTGRKPILIIAGVLAVVMLLWVGGAVASDHSSFICRFFGGELRSMGGKTSCVHEDGAP